MPVVGVADNEIEDVFPLGQDQDGCVPGLGPDFNNLVGLGLDAKDARGLSCRLCAGRRGRVVSDGDKGSKANSQNARGDGVSDHCTPFARCSMPRTRPCSSTAWDRFSASTAEDV